MASTPPKDHLLRAVYPGVEFASTDANDDSIGTLTGHFAVWNEWIEVNSVFEGHFMERFSPGAFKKTFSERQSRMRCIFRHGLDPQIGQKVLGPVERLEEDDHGASYVVPLFDTSYNRDLLPGLKAGQYGSSFEFGIVKQEYKRRPQRSDFNPNGLDERTVTEAFVTEFGPCTFPQYAGTTAGVRSVTDDIMRERLQQAEQHEPRGNATISTSGVTVPVGTGTTESNATTMWAEVATPERNKDLRKHQRSFERVGASPWAIHPQTLATILQVIGEVSAGAKLDEDEVRERVGGRTREAKDPVGSVAVLDLYGPIMPHENIFTWLGGGTSVETFQQELRGALSAKDIKTIVLNIDSPGGEVSLVPELAAEVKAARSKKKIVAVANTFAASAAYWVASQASELYVTPSGEVGSIGVYSAHQDISALEEAVGIKTTLVSAGKYKVERNPFEPLDDTAREEMQRSVDETHAIFVKAVAQGRGTTIENVRKNYGQGRMVRPADALKTGMVDGIATLDEVLQRALDGAPSKRSLEPEPDGATTQEYEPEPSRATTQAREELDALKARVEAEHRSVRAYVNGLKEEL